MTEAKTQITSALLLSLSLCCSALGQDFFPTPIERGPLAVAIKEFAVLPDSGSGSGAPARMSVMTADPLGRLLVNDQRGPLYIVSTDGEAVTEYLDLRDFPTLQINSSGGEWGFQSFTFHPDFNAQDTAGFGKFYTIHSSNNTTPTPDFDPGGGTSFHTLLLEWTTDVPASSTFVPANAAQPFREVLRFDQPFGNHNAGLIAFNTSVGSADPDRTNLYIAMGDGGSGGDPQENGQDAGNPYGAILRIDPTGTDSGNGQYGIVSDNAFAADGDGGTLAEIYSYGLRNPQRFGWDIATGAMYIADIGQNAVEEIDLGVNGGNFGWDQREGSFDFEGEKTADMIDPLAEYDHTNVVSDPPTSIVNRAITTGEVARGTGIPGLDGSLLLGDFPTGLIFYLNVDTDPLNGGQDGLAELITLADNGDPVRLLDAINQTRADRGLDSVTRADLRFSLGIDGAVYILNKRDGIIRRLAAVPGDVNLDGEVNGLDVDPFVEVLLSGPYQVEADMNEDQVVNGLDVDPFVAAVVGGTHQIPEPSTFLLSILALAVVGGWRKWGG